MILRVRYRCYLIGANIYWQYDGEYSIVQGLHTKIKQVDTKFVKYEYRQIGDKSHFLIGG